MESSVMFYWSILHLIPYNKDCDEIHLSSFWDLWLLIADVDVYTVLVKSDVWPMKIDFFTLYSDYWKCVKA